MGEFLSLPCFEAPQETLPLPWGSYEIEVAGLSADESCFTVSEPVALVPGTNGVAIMVPRVLEERSFEPCEGGDSVVVSAPPLACADCTHCAPASESCGGAGGCDFEVCK
jgi:hypothetical protein